MPSVMYFTTVSDFDKDENIIFFNPVIGVGVK